MSYKYLHVRLVEDCDGGIYLILYTARGGEGRVIIESK
jgi:hypothetical protein